MSMRKLIAAGVLALGLTPGVGMADGWVVTLGGRFTASPPYEGAGHDVFVPSPTFSLRRADSVYRFTPPDDGSSLSLLSSRYLDFGPVARFRYERGDQGQLTGLDKVGWAAEPGVFVNLWPANWLRGRVEARHGFGGHRGWVGDAGIDLIYTGPRWEASVGPRIGYGDTKYVDAYFGVSPAEAARGPTFTSIYEPKGGRRYAGIEAAVGYRVFGGLRVIGDVGYHRLAPDLANSPIVRVAGSKDQISAGVGASYSFGVGR